MPLQAVNNREDEADRTVDVTWTAINGLGLKESQGRARPTSLTITDDDPPEMHGHDQVEYIEHETTPVATYTALDLAGGGLTWGVFGLEKTAFTIGPTTGVLRFTQTPPDHEASRGNRYDATVEATDRHGITGILTVTVTVEDKPDEVSLS